MSARMASNLAARLRAPAGPLARWPRRPCVHTAAAGTPADRAAHNELQAATFNAAALVQEFTSPLPPEIMERLTSIVAAVPGLGAHSRVVDVGTGTGCLVPHLQSRGVQDILAVDVAANMLAALQRAHPPPSTVGNDAGVRTWQGDSVDLPAYMGPVDAFFFNAVFGNVHSQREALLRACLLLKPGGHIVVSHPLGRAWQAQLAAEQPQLVPHPLPVGDALKQLIGGLPLQLVELRDEPDLYLAVLQVPPRYSFPGAPLRMAAPVVRGFGRGSRQLGVPTANMDPEVLQGELQRLPTGVYFGWAQLEPPGSWPAADGGVHKMVMNVGSRPTVNAGDEAPTVEVHVLHAYSQEEFYGAALRVVVVGFLRPEMRFGGLGDLLARIRADIGVARAQLDDPAHAAHAHSEWFARRV